jgi:GT2 family glycosyltransferase
MARVDVVVVSYNSRDHLRSCVEELSLDSDVNVVVVDSASADGSLEALAGLAVTAIPLGENRGFAYATNRGIRHGSAEFVLLLNPDAVLERSSLDVLLRALEQDSALGAVGPRIVDEDGHLHYSIRRFPRAVSSFAQALFLHRVWPHADWVDELVRNHAAYAQRHSVDWISGACILLRRSAVDAIGGLDAGFFLYREDADLCRRLQDAGYRVDFEPGATCVHVGGTSHPREALLGILAQSRVRYASKHGGPLARALERAGVVLGAATHVVFGAGGWRRRRGHLLALRAAAGSFRRPPGPTRS